MTKRTRFSLLAALVVLGALGCGCSPEDTAESSDRLRVLDYDLSVGATGPDVVALHEYLSAFGYFPNDELAQRFPSWRAVVDTRPDDPAVYDERTAEAVSGLQSRTGLPATGVVDADTREILKVSRCGNPDGRAADPSEKFALTPSSWGVPPITLRWKVENGGPDATQAVTSTTVSAALNTWAATTSLTFQQVTGSQTADIRVKWVPLGTFTNSPAARCEYPFSTPRTLLLELNSDREVSTATPTPSGVRDLQTLVLHELGHCLGLYHSSVGPDTSLNSPVMYFLPPYGSQKRALHADDKQAISARYDTWETLTGQAHDVGIGWHTNLLTGTTAMSIWLVGGDAAPGGFNVYRFNGSTRELATGGRGATRIATDSTGKPWIVDSAGNTYRRTSSSASSGSWTQVPGCARDIGISPTEGGSFPSANAFQVWKIDCLPVTPLSPNGIVKKWDHAANNWLTTTGSGTRIAVDAGGRPYVTDASGNIRSATTNSTSTSWTDQLCCGVDVAVANSWVWLIGTNSGIHLRNLQASRGDAPAANGWIFVNGFGSAIAADPDGRAYVAGTDFSFKRAYK